MERFRQSTESQVDYLGNLWRQYGFMGRAPKSGSVAEQRLRDLCRQYTKIVLNKQGYSDNERRNLHNQIAIMTVGQSRSNLNNRMAERVADFASEFAAGFTLDELAKYDPPTEQDFI